MASANRERRARSPKNEERTNNKVTEQANGIRDQSVVDLSDGGY
jgi:hypothetical protein